MSGLRKVVAYSYRLMQCCVNLVYRIIYIEIEGTSGFVGDCRNLAFWNVVMKSNSIQSVEVQQRLQPCRIAGCDCRYCDHCRHCDSQHREQHHHSGQYMPKIQRNAQNICVCCFCCQGSGCCRLSLSHTIHRWVAPSLLELTGSQRPTTVTSCASASPRSLLLRRSGALNHLRKR